MSVLSVLRVLDRCACSACESQSGVDFAAVIADVVVGRGGHPRREENVGCDWSEGVCSRFNSDSSDFGVTNIINWKNSLGYLTWIKEADILKDGIIVIGHLWGERYIDKLTCFQSPFIFSPPQSFDLPASALDLH